MTGTSMSAPMVTAAAAFLYSYRTDLQLSDIRNALLETAHRLPTLEGKLSSNGMLDIYAAINYGRTTETAQSNDTAADESGNARTQDTTAQGTEAQDAADQSEAGQGTASQETAQKTTSKTISAGGGESVRLD